MTARQFLSDLAAEPARLVTLAVRAQLVAGPLWCVQAAAIASLIDGWLHGVVMIWPVVAFASAGLLRIGVHRWSRSVLFRDAQTRTSQLRAALLETETRCLDRAISSSAFAALVAEKIPLLLPYFTRYRPAVLRAMVLPAFFVIVSATVSWVVALILLVALPLVPVFMILVGMAAKEASAKQLDEVSSLNTLLADRLAAVVDLRLLNAGQRAEADFAERADSLRIRTIAVLRIAFLSSTVLELVAAIGVAMVAVFVGFTLLGELTFGTWSSPLSPGQGIFLLLLAPEAFQPLRDFAAAWHDKSAAEAVAEEIESLQAQDRDLMLGQGDGRPAAEPQAGLSIRAGAVNRGANRIGLPDLTVAPGEAVALTGPSGRGKTSTLLAIAGLLPLAQGEIWIGGTRLSDQSVDGLRAQMAWVPQRVQFPDITLAAFLDPQGDPDRYDVALKMAAVQDVLDRLPDGLNTRLGETGTGLSGGEARRLLLARAFYRQSPLILADEPTADLNSELVGTILQSLRACAASGAAVLVATHDPQVVAAMDREVSLS